MKDLQTALFSICDEMGVEYNESFDSQKIYATHYCFKFLNKMLKDNYGTDVDDEDVSLRCIQNQNHVTIHIIDYCLEFKQSDFDYFKKGFQFADSFQITKTKKSMVMMSVDFIW